MNTSTFLIAWSMNRRRGMRCATMYGRLITFRRAYAGGCADKNKRIGWLPSIKKQRIYSSLGGSEIWKRFFRMCLFCIQLNILIWFRRDKSFHSTQPEQRLNFAKNCNANGKNARLVGNNMDACSHAHWSTLNIWFGWDSANFLCVFSARSEQRQKT